MTMTQQYLSGELSVLLARLQTTAGDASARDVARLRYEAETVPWPALGSVVVRALGLTEKLCWNSLTLGDTDAFTHQAVVGAELRSFAECAGLLGEV
jgi:hypothetical protein